MLQESTILGTCQNVPISFFNTPGACHVPGPPSLNEERCLSAAARCLGREAGSQPLRRENTR
eukprot:6653679-Prymnesium_polylepis.1